MIIIDFETRSRADIKKTGAYKYAADDSTDVLCMAYKIGNNRTKLISNFESIPKDLEESIVGGDTFVAHNAFFEICIWNNVLFNKYNWPMLTKWRCTMAMAQAVNLPPSLELAAEALKLPIKKDMSGHRIMLKMSKPRTPTLHNPAIWHNNPKDFKTLYEYCIKDVDTTYELMIRLPLLSDTEQKIWELNNSVNLRGVPVNVRHCDTVIKFLEEYATELSDELSDLTQGEVTTTSQLQRIIDYASRLGFKIESLDKDFVEKYLAMDNVPKNVRRILEIRKDLGGSATKKYQSFLNYAHKDRIRGSISYHGASTGRFSGRGIQPQNMTKGKESDVKCIKALLDLGEYELFKPSFNDVQKDLSKSVRSMIESPKNHEFLCCDFSAIEARILAWFAQEEDLLDEFKKGKDGYIVQASKIYNIPASIVNKDQRALGKAARLGLGYAMGPTKFHTTCKSGGIEVSPDICEKTVKLYRSSYPKIKALWYEVERASLQAVKLFGTSVHVGCCEFLMKGKHLYCILPSGRKIVYNNAHIKICDSPIGPKETLHFSTFNCARKWHTDRTYGGKLVENICQAIGRDLLCYSMLELDKLGYKIIMHVHDEILIESPIGKHKIKDVESIMSKGPKWAKGLPLAAEGWVGVWYRK